MEENWTLEAAADGNADGADGDVDGCGYNGGTNLNSIGACEGGREGEGEGESEAEGEGEGDTVRGVQRKST